MRHRLFLVHGMGVHREGWERPYRRALVRAYGRYPRLARAEFDERFELIPVEYDSVLRNVVGRWAQDAAAVGQAAAEVDAGDVRNLVQWLRAAAGEEHNFPWSHCGDVILYRLYPAVRDAVRVHVARQLAEVIAELDGAPFSVIGYSMGTIVAHDALHMLWTRTLPGDGATGFGPGQAHAQVVAMIANVSRVLESVADVYRSTVQPGSAGRAGRGCDVYLTARHQLDPFPTPRPFEPVSWPDAGAEGRGDYVPIQVAHVHEWNVHAFEHYLESPRVHIPLLRALTFDSAISREAEREALESFPEFGIAKARAIGVRQWLEDHAPARSDDWKAFCAIAAWYMAGPADP